MIRFMGLMPSKFEDIDATPEENFAKAYNVAKSTLGDLKEII